MKNNELIFIIHLDGERYLYEILTLLSYMFMGKINLRSNYIKLISEFNLKRTQHKK